MSGTAVPRGYEVRYHCKEEGCKFSTTELRLIEDHTSTHSPAPRVTPHKARPDMCGRRRVSARLAGKTRGRRKVAGAKISVTAEDAADVDEDVVMGNDVDDGMKVDVNDVVADNDVKTDVNDVMADNDVKTDVNDVKATSDTGEMKCDIAGEKTDAADIKVEQDCTRGDSKAAVKVKGKEKVKGKVKGKAEGKAKAEGKVKAKVKAEAEVHPVLEAIRKEVRDRYYTRPSYTRRSKADDVALPPGCECAPCGFKFKTWAELTSHQRLRHSDTNATRRALCVPGQVYACYRRCDTGAECTRTFKRGDDLVHHIASHHEGVPAGAAARAPVHECLECGYQCRRRVTLRQHCDAVHLRIRRHMCHICGDAFFDKCRLRRHLSTVHRSASDPPAPQYECDTCGRRFNQRGNLAQHLVQHDAAAKAAAQLVCDTCGKMYSGTRSLRIHVESQHERQVRYECGECGYRAYKKSHLLSHQVARHGREAKHQCGHCGKYFPQAAKLLDHLRRGHRQGVTPATHHSTPVYNNSTQLVSNNSTPVFTRSIPVPNSSTLLSNNSTLVCNNSTLVFNNSTPVFTKSLLVPNNSTLLSNNSTLVCNSSTLLSNNSRLVCNNSTPLIAKSTPVSTVSAGISRTMIVLTPKPPVVANTITVGISSRTMK